MPPTINSVEDVEQAISQLFGDLPRRTGILQRLEAWRGPADFLVGLRPGPPSGDVRRLVRGLTRARAEAVITTVEDLGPVGRFTPGDPEARLGQVLADWRRRFLGHERPPVILIIDPRGELDLDHPSLSGPGRHLLYTGLDGLWAMESRAADRGIEIAADTDPDLAGAVRLLRREFGAATLLLETSPGSHGKPGEEGVLVDERTLVVFEGPRLEAEAEGSWVLPLDELAVDFDCCPDPWSAGPGEEPWSVYHWGRRGRNPYQLTW